MKWSLSRWSQSRGAFESRRGGRGLPRSLGEELEGARERRLPPHEGRGAGEINHIRTAETPEYVSRPAPPSSQSLITGPAMPLSYVSVIEKEGGIGSQKMKANPLV